MELFLNILWLLIAVSALALWRIVWKGQERCLQHRPLQEWTALACALVFVFFAVSLSDDLREAVILAEDYASGRHHALVSNGGHVSHPNRIDAHACSGAEASHAAFFVSLHVLERIAPATIQFDRRTEADPPGSRSPPFPSL